MNGLKRLKELKKAEFLAELRKILGDRYDKNLEPEYMELKELYEDKAAGMAIRQIAEQFRYKWETTAVYLNAKEAPPGRRGGEGIQAFFVTDEATPVNAFLYGPGTSPFTQFHRYTLSGREIPNRGSHSIVNYNDEGEVESDKVIALLKQAAEKIDTLFKPDIVIGGVPKVVVGKIIPFVTPEPEWPSAEEREPGEQVRPKGNQPIVQYIAGQLQPAFNATMSDGGQGRVRFHIRPTKAAKPPMEWFISQADLQKLQEQQEAQADITAPMAQLVGNQGAIMVGSLYRVERVTQPDRREVVYRDMDIFYVIPDEEASQIVLPAPERRGRGAGAAAPAKDVEGDIITMARGFDYRFTDSDLSLIACEDTEKKTALQSLIDKGRIKIETSKTGEKVYVYVPPEEKEEKPAAE